MDNQNSETAENTLYEDIVETQQNMVETQPEKKKNRTSWVVIGILLVVLLAGAAFVGGSLLRKQSVEAPDDMAFDFTPAKEVPQTKPELTGMVTKVDGDTLSVEAFDMNDMMGDMTGMGEGGVMIDEGASFTEEMPISGEAGSVGEYGSDDSEGEEVIPEFFGTGGPVTEVVITHDTKIYKDTTWENYDFMAESDEESDTMEQKVEPGSADEIGNSGYVTVWGERRGDRVIATFILYEAPMEYSDEIFNEEGS
jgi:hypothetical protein